MAVKPGKTKSKATLRTLAAALGVAPSTVSNAYNRPDQLSPALRERILETARDLGYAGPDPTAASLSRGSVGALGVVYPSPLSYTFTDPVAGLLIRGVALEAERSSYGLLLIGGEADAAPDDRAAPPAPSLAATAHVDGFILHNFPGSTRTLRQALARGLPSVLVDHTGVEGLPSVTVDDAGGAYAAAKHLLELGHRRLGVITLEFTLDAQGGLADPLRQRRAAYLPTKERLRGYARAVREAGLAWEAVAVYETRDNTPAEGEQAAAALLRQPDAPTALLAMSDPLALGALRYAQARGLAIPGALSVVGYDDADVARQVTPGLTTVRQPHVEKGRQAAALLIGQLRGEAAASVVLETALVVRGSSAPAAP